MSEACSLDQTKRKNRNKATDFLGNALALLQACGRVNYTFDCKFVPK